MKLLIKQRVFSWTDTYDIYDEDGNVRYFVKGDFFSIGHRLRVFVVSFTEKFQKNNILTAQIHSGLQWMGSRGQYNGMGVRCLCWRGSGHAYIERDFPLGRHLCDRYC